MRLARLRRQMNPAHAPYHVPFAALVIICPRVGGGNQSCEWTTTGSQSLSPRRRGKPPPTGNFSCCPRSIPAWAGNWMSEHNVALVQRSIPAWAGESGVKSRCVRLSRVYPRLGGGIGAEGAHRTLQGGLSPLGRGNPYLVCSVVAVLGPIPASTGGTSSTG